MATVDDVQLSWLTSFLAVIDHGTFTAAAQATHRSQSRISAHIAALEDTLDVRLLQRGARSTTATEAGTRFLTYARSTLAEVRAGMDSVETLSGQLQGTVVVGSFPGASGVLLAPLIKRFREQHPGVSVELHEGEPRWLEDAVATFGVDLALRSGDIPLRHSHTASQHLVDERILLVTPRDSALAHADEIDTTWLAERALVVTGAPSEGWTDFTERLAALDTSPSRIVNVAHPTTVVALVRARLGVGLIGEMAASITAIGDDVTTRPMREPAWSRDIRIYWNSRRQLSEAASAFFEAVTASSRTPS